MNELCYGIDFDAPYSGCGVDYEYAGDAEGC